jgi:hypothetical protein
MAAGLTGEIALGRQIRRLWIVVVPICLYGLWWIGYQQTNVSHDSVYFVTRFMFDAAAGVLSSLAGLVSPNPLVDSGDYLSWGAPLLVGAMVVLGWRLHRLALAARDAGRPGPPPLWAVPGRLLTLLATALAFWLITGVGRAVVVLPNFIFTSTGDESRYLYVGAVLVVLIAAEALRGVRITRRAQLIATVLVAAAVLSNIGVIRTAAQDQRGRSAVTEAELGALDITRGQVSPSFRPSDFVFGVLEAGPYFQAEDALGSPAASPAQIASEPDSVRAAADRQLIAIHQVALTSASSVTNPTGAGPLHVDAMHGLQGATLGACGVLSPAPTGGTLDLTLPAGGLLLEVHGAPATLQLRRFATAFEPLGTLEPDQPALLRIAPDRAPQPWHLEVQVAGQLRLCSAGD